MEKNPKSPSELNNNSQNIESDKTDQEKTSPISKETNSINSINFSQKNDSLFRSKRNNNNLYSNSESLYPLLFT
jgi:hypothetical protein